MHAYAWTRLTAGVAGVSQCAVQSKQTSSAAACRYVTTLCLSDCSSFARVDKRSRVNFWRAAVSVQSCASFPPVHALAALDSCGVTKKPWRRGLTGVLSLATQTAQRARPRRPYPTAPAIPACYSYSMSPPGYGGCASLCCGKKGLASPPKVPLADTYARSRGKRSEIVGPAPEPNGAVLRPVVSLRAQHVHQPRRAPLGTSTFDPAPSPGEDARVSRQTTGARA
jgi:hypothetical protein